MTNVALIFPGQGAQKVGMGKEFYNFSSEARSIFDEADKTLNNNLSQIIFEGPAEKLTSTAFCQPGILTVSIALLKAFQSHSKFQNIKPQFTAGLSLGEYSALVAAGALSFTDAIRLVERRAYFMEEETKMTPGTMAAIIGFNRSRLQEICKQTNSQIANYNSPEQIVITGPVQNVQEACQIIKNEGAKSVIPLDVSGAFHSSLMLPATKKFEKELEKITILNCTIPIISNVHALPQTSPPMILSNLAKQIISSVRWEESIQYISSQGIQDFIEIGPGKILKGLIRWINPVLRVINIERPEDLESLPF